MDSWKPAQVRRHKDTNHSVQLFHLPFSIYFVNNSAPHSKLASVGTIRSAANWKREKGVGEEMPNPVIGKPFPLKCAKIFIKIVVGLQSLIRDSELG